MRTSVEISDALLARARRLMAERGVTLRQLVEEGLRELVDRASRTPAFKLRDERFRGRGGFAPGASAADVPAAIRDMNAPRGPGIR